MWATEGIKPPKYLWHESVDMLEQVIAYCRTDVLTESELSAALPDLNPQETQLFLMDLEINLRGFQLDKEAVSTALQLIHREGVILNQELSQLTDDKVKKATQRARIIAWCSSQGYDLPDTKAATLDEVLKTPWEMTADIQRVVEIVRALGRSSTAKYQAMKNWAGKDWRVRGGVLYHGASTGRWSGKGVQPHNFPKGTLKNVDMDELWTVLKAQQRPEIGTRYKSVMEALAQGLRGAIVAKKGHTLYVADYASIEARVLLWLADDQDALDVFREHRDPYSEMAEAIYGYPCSKETTPKERQIGKIACLGADTLIVTSTGIKPLAAVTMMDLLWDGEEWVAHEGCVYNGQRETLCLNGVTITPDHLVFVDGMWLPAEKVAHNDYTYYRALVSGMGNSWSQAASTAHAEGLWTHWYDAVVQKQSLLLLNRTYEKGLPLDAMRAPKRKPTPHDKSGSGTMRISSRISATGLACLTGLVRSLRAVKILIQSSFTTMGVGAFGSTESGWKATGKSGGEVRYPAAESSWHISLGLKAGTTPSSNWTGFGTTKDTRPLTCVSLPDELTVKTNDKSRSSSNEFRTWKPVYDFVNTGPRHRYTIVTNAGPLIVHNCLGLGYQMGASKFQATCETYGIEIDEGFAQEVVEAYRAKFPLVKQMWYEQEQTAIDALHAGNKGEILWNGKVGWTLEGSYLYCILPSGRRLAYPFPKLVLKRTPWGDVRYALTFMGIDTRTHQWQRQHTYGGMIVENITQAVARDVMAEAMLSCEASGYPLVLSVHDELISEGPIGGGSVQEFEQLLTTLPSWARSCPIGAEGWSGLRYHK